jgi:hypothetical protein
MNLTTLSSGSVQSSSRSEKTERPVKAKKESGKGGTTDLDLSLKLQAARALSASGYYCKVNVSLSAVGGQGLSDVTDVDVLALRYDVGFRPATVAVSCKSGESKTQSVSREVFYVRGVLNYLGADEGVVLFSRRTVAQHMKELGRQLGVLVLSGNEVEEWTRSLQNGVPVPGYFQDVNYPDFMGSVAHPAVETLADYLASDFWFYRDFRNIQNVLGHYKKVAPTLSGNASWHKVVVLDAAIHLCISLLELCRYIRFVGLPALGEKTAAYLFGGVTSFKARRDLYAKVVQLLTSTGMTPKNGPILPPLEPAYTPALAEIVLRFIERPHSSIRVLQVLQDEMWRVFGAPGISFEEDTNTLATQKLAQDLLDFLKAASGAPWGPRF